MLLLCSNESLMLINVVSFLFNDVILLFLDITITLKNNKHNFEIYRKNTFTGIIIDNLSNHPSQHKMAAIRVYLERLNRIPMSEAAYMKEIKTIKAIAIKNNFNTNLVDKINNRINEWWRRILIFCIPPA